MSTTTLICDQAIFTSIPTPMGEGYRIVATSRGLRPREKQAITRLSPSHDALCHPAGEETDNYGIAFYTLPSGKLCVALSCCAGAEHTGRGGDRVYTHNVIFEADQFPRCTYNPFAVLRAMVKAGLNSPQLKPPPVLPELHLPMHDTVPETTGNIAVSQGSSRREGQCSWGWGLELRRTLSAAWRSYVLDALLDGRSLIVNLTDGWLGAAEALFMGIPGPMRADVSFSVGLRFSVSRCHRLFFLRDEQGATKSRTAGRPIEYLEPAAQQEPTPEIGAWLSFVERHWSRGDTSRLSRRTSQPFSDLSATARERVGRVYNELDTIPHTDTAELLAVTVGHLGEPERGVETDIVAELVVTAQSTLLDRLDKMSWEEASRHWDMLCSLPWQSAEARLFVRPLIEQCLRVAARKHAAVAAHTALRIARRSASGEAGSDTMGPGTELSAVVDDVLTRLAEWAEGATDAEFVELSETSLDFEELVSRWQAVRPRCPIVQRLHQRRASVMPLPTPH